MAYTNSSLVSYTCLSPNHSGQRTHSIDRITIHMVVGQLSMAVLGSIFLPVSRQASSNYGVCTDGIALYVPEAYRSWCSSSNANDQRAITIETSNDAFYPYAVRDDVYARLLDLCVDICKRNGKNKLLWLGSKEKVLAYEPQSNEMVLTLHKWFADTACPGKWLEDHMAEIASKVTARLTVSYPELPFSVKVRIPDLNLRKTASGAVMKQIGVGNYVVSKISGEWGYLDVQGGWINIVNPDYVTIGQHIEVSPFKDVEVGDGLYPAVKACYKAGLIGGYPDKTFRPDNKLTRAQLATVMYKYMVYKKMIKEDVKMAETSPFKDVKTTDPQFKYIYSVYKAGIMNGYSNGKFKPKAKVTRRQLAVVASKLLAK